MIYHHEHIFLKKKYFFWGGFLHLCGIPLTSTRIILRTIVVFADLTSPAKWPTCASFLRVITQYHRLKTCHFPACRDGQKTAIVRDHLSNNNIKSRLLRTLIVRRSASVRIYIWRDICLDYHVATVFLTRFWTQNCFFSRSAFDDKIQRKSHIFSICAFVSSTHLFCEDFLKV